MLLEFKQREMTLIEVEFAQVEICTLSILEHTIWTDREIG